MVPNIEEHSAEWDVLRRILEGEDVEQPPIPQLGSTLSVDDPEVAAAIKLSM